VPCNEEDGGVIGQVWFQVGGPEHLTNGGGVVAECHDAIFVIGVDMDLEQHIDSHS